MNKMVITRDLLMATAKEIILLSQEKEIYAYARHDLKCMLSNYDVPKVAYIEEKDYEKAYSELNNILKIVKSL